MRADSDIEVATKPSKAWEKAWEKKNIFFVNY